MSEGRAVLQVSSHGVQSTALPLDPRNLLDVNARTFLTAKQRPWFPSLLFLQCPAKRALLPCPGPVCACDHPGPPHVCTTPAASPLSLLLSTPRARPLTDPQTHQALAFLGGPCQCGPRGCQVASSRLHSWPVLLQASSVAPAESCLPTAQPSRSPACFLLIRSSGAGPRLAPGRETQLGAALLGPCSGGACSLCPCVSGRHRCPGPAREGGAVSQPAASAVRLPPQPSLPSSWAAGPPQAHTPAHKPSKWFPPSLSFRVWSFFLIYPKGLI